MYRGPFIHIFDTSGLGLKCAERPGNTLAFDPHLFEAQHCEVCLLFDFFFVQSTTRMREQSLPIAKRSADVDTYVSSENLF